MGDLLAADGPLVSALLPMVVCAVAAVIVAAVIRVVGHRLLDDPAEADSLGRTAFVGILAVGVLLGIGRLVGREATDQGLQQSLEGIILALPGLTISFILVIAALLVAAILRATVSRVVGAIRPAIARTAGAAVYWAVVILVSLIAAEQAGIDVAVLRQILLLTLGAVLAATAIGVGLGMRPLLSSVIAGRHVDAGLRVGTTVTVADGAGGTVSGEVVQVGNVSVVLRTVEGRTVDVPHLRFLEGTSTRG